MVLDVCFSDSLAGNLIMHNGTVKSVANLDLHLDVGNLSEGIFSKKRKAAINALYRDPWLYGESIYNWRYWKKKTETLERIKEHARNGGEVRVWYSMDVKDLCGYMFLLSELKDINCEVWGVLLQASPDWLACADGGWGQIERGDVESFLRSAWKVPPGERAQYAKKWEELCTQPWTLRTCMNGTVIGVPEDFFDSLLLSYIPQGEFRMMEVLGELIRNCGGAVQYDYWHGRLTALLHTERFELTRDYSEKESKDYNPPIYKMWFRSRIPVMPCMPLRRSDEIMRCYGEIDAKGRYIPEANAQNVIDFLQKECPEGYCGLCDHDHWGRIIELKESRESKHFFARYPVR